ncbi:hypothetical protein C8R44DRAFT_728874 [Mycena epipterygia]|nr:hypothetical protein C8R44DRAFT_728874 [Mycena epipterygia]
MEGLSMRGLDLGDKDTYWAYMRCNSYDKYNECGNFRGRSSRPEAMRITRPGVMMKNEDQTRKNERRFEIRYAHGGDSIQVTYCTSNTPDYHPEFRTFGPLDCLFICAGPASIPQINFTGMMGKRALLLAQRVPGRSLHGKDKTTLDIPAIVAKPTSGHLARKGIQRLSSRPSKPPLRVTCNEILDSQEFIDTIAPRYVARIHFFGIQKRTRCIHEKNGTGLQYLCICRSVDKATPFAPFARSKDHHWKEYRRQRRESMSGLRKSFR